ncbi:MAG TPA: type IV pilus assembly protein PilM [Jatrophihabitantaceae bacterium]|jgi:type IV pilus assembly protein PilM
MKHRQLGIAKVGVINPDGHAIGLDIGATAVRAAVLAPGTLEGRASVTVHGLAAVSLPPGTVVNGVVNDQAALTAALKRLWQANKFACRNVILGIANPQILVRDLQMPRLDPRQLAKALPFRAGEIVALPMDQVVLDFAPLGEPDPESNLMSGLLVATPREPVLAAVTAVEQAGLHVARVDLASFAALRSIADEHLSVEAVVDLGAQLTTIVIHNRGVPRLVRTLSRGGDELTEHVADALGLNAERAERVKRETGLTGRDAATSGAINDGIRPLLAEIRNSINYFVSASDGARLERISLTGGAAALPGLSGVLSEQNGVPTAVVTPMRHVRNRWASKQAHPEASGASASAVSVGLAMGAAA